METRGSGHCVNFSAPKGFPTKLKSKCKETFFPDDPFKAIGAGEARPSIRAKRALQYFLPICEWLPSYNLEKLKYDVLAGVTITSLAIPQGISYAKLANIPAIIGLYSSFVPAFMYPIFGSSKYLAVGTVAACSLILQEIVGAKASPTEQPELYLHLIFTTTFITGIFQFALGFFRLGIIVDFLSHSTITGFMAGTATIIGLQQLKGMLGMVHFTHKTDVVSVIRAVFVHKDEWKWQSAVAGVCFLAFLQATRTLSKKKPKLFWVSAMAPLVVVLVGCLSAFLVGGEKRGIKTVGHLKKGLNPPSLQYLNFDSKYLPSVIKAAIITGTIALTEGIAIGRSFGLMRNEQIDGNKEMIAFGVMNLVGSLTSCYLTTGPFSKTAVNFNAGSQTPMSNVVMGVGMMLVLLFLAPLFSYTPLVALSAIIMSAMISLIKYDEIFHLYKVDKFDFCICMAAFLGVAFISMDYGLMMSVIIALLRGVLYIARPEACKLSKLPNSSLYRDEAQYPFGTTMPGMLILQLGSPVYFANSNYVRERVMRYIREEEDPVEHLLLDLSGVTSIDMTGIETLMEIRRMMHARGTKVMIINPRMDVVEKMMLSGLVDKFGKENVFLSIDDAVEACRFSLQDAKEDREP